MAVPQRTKGWLFLREEGCATTGGEGTPAAAGRHAPPPTHLGHGLGVHDGPILAPLPQEALDAQLLARVTEAGSQAHLARGGRGQQGAEGGHTRLTSREQGRDLVLPQQARSAHTPPPHAHGHTLATPSPPKPRHPITLTLFRSRTPPSNGRRRWGARAHKRVSASSLETPSNDPNNCLDCRGTSSPNHDAQCNTLATPTFLA